MEVTTFRSCWNQIFDDDSDINLIIMFDSYSNSLIKTISVAYSSQFQFRNQTMFALLHVRDFRGDHIIVIFGGPMLMLAIGCTGSFELDVTEVYTSL